MNIYLSLAKNINSSDTQNNLNGIRKILLSNRHEILSAKKAADTSDQQLFLNKKKLIEKADCIIAEVSQTSLDQGGEIVYSLTLNKPVLALIKSNEKDSLTPMLTGNPSDRLFIEYYDQQNIRYVLKKFIKHVRFLSNNKGQLVVLDGGDGSGKATQSSLLRNYLAKQKTNYRFYDFPRYYSSFHGKIVGRMLAGEFGELNSLSPYLASLAYALDRATVKEEISDFLESGGLIICNRYVTSSMAHWGGRFQNKNKQKEFLHWLMDLEYKIHQMPKENIVIYLYVPWKLSLELTKKKGYRQYLKSKRTDIVEEDIEYQVQSEKTFLLLCKHYKHWFKIDCVNKQGKMYTRSNIHQKIIKLLKSRKIVK